MWAVGLIAVLLGFAWITSFSVLIVTCQLTVPDWVRARAIAILMLTFGISAAPASAVWGYLADQWGISTSIALAGLGTLVTMVFGYWLPLGGQIRDPTPSDQLDTLPKHDIDHSDGPVTVTRQYNIEQINRGNFHGLMVQIKAVRKRNGALSWRLNEDTPGHYSEVVVIEDWLDYLRQRERMSVDDHRLEEQLALLNHDQEPPLMTHAIA